MDTRQFISSSQDLSPQKKNLHYVAGVLVIYTKEFFAYTILLISLFKQSYFQRYVFKYDIFTCRLDCKCVSGVRNELTVSTGQNVCVLKSFMGFFIFLFIFLFMHLRSYIQPFNAETNLCLSNSLGLLFCFCKNENFSKNFIRGF